MAVELHSNLPKLAAQIATTASDGVFKATKDVEGWAKTNAPVDTGNLQNSIRGTMPALFVGRVSVGAEYGEYVEYGTYKMSAQPFLVPAAEAVRPQFIAYMKALV